MNITWRESPNRRIGRQGHTPDFIVLHTTGASFVSAVYTVTNPASQVSYHFIIAQNGDIVQTVDIENTAWANGTTNNGDNRDNSRSAIPAVRQRRVNANNFTVSIGFGDMPAGNPSAEQLKAAAELILHIRDEVKRIYGQVIPLTRTHIVGHHEVTPVTRPNCPGRAFPFDKLIRRLCNEGCDFPVSEENIRAMVSLGVISCADRLRGVTDVKWLDRLLTNASLPQVLDSRIHNGITDLDTALKILTDAGIINSPDYWRNVPELESLLISLANRSRDPLERVIWAEARGEDTKGKILVGNVVLNRVLSPAFPDSIYEVIFQPGQFEPVRNGAYRRAAPTTAIKRAVDKLLDGADYSQGATFFRSVNGLEGSWHERALTHLFTHGNHAFFN